MFYILNKKKNPTWNIYIITLNKVQLKHISRVNVNKVYRLQFTRNTKQGPVNADISCF